MSARYLLDTNICICIAKRNPPAFANVLPGIAAASWRCRQSRRANCVSAPSRANWHQLALPNFAKQSTINPMSTMNISLPDSLKSFVDDQVSQRGYGTSSEYVRELIRKDQDRLQLRGLLLAGAASPPAAAADAAYFADLRARVAQRPGR